MSYRSKPNPMSRSSAVATNSLGSTLAATPRAAGIESVRLPPDPIVEPPGADPPAPSAETPDVAVGALAQPARIGTDASSNARTICEQRFTIVPPLQRPRVCRPGLQP